MCNFSFFTNDDSKKIEAKSSNSQTTKADNFNKLEVPEQKNIETINKISEEKPIERRVPPVWICP